MRRPRQLRSAEGWEESADFQAEQWVGKELAGGEFHDVRHGKRLRKVLEQFSEKIGGSTPWACLR